MIVNNIMNNFKNKQFYKILKNGKSCHKGDFEWSLPSKDTPGEWHEHDGEIALGEAGFHITDDPLRWLNMFNRIGNQVYPVEIDWDAGFIQDITINDQSVTIFNQVAVKKLRLLPPVDMIEYNGNQIFMRDGYLDRGHDLPAKISSKGDQEWWNSGELHRCNDKPALIMACGHMAWYQHGKLHRTNGPAVMHSSGNATWYQHGEIGRIDESLPADLRADGRQVWYRSGVIHRGNDLPAIIDSNGDQKWYQNGQIHRDEDKPAIIMGSGTRFWMRKGRIHRDNNLPAVLYSDGTKRYYLNGEEYFPDQAVS
jgi:hypothetical protein